MAIDLYSELRRLVDALDEERVEYALAGALALAVHGVVRATADIDVLIRPEDEQRAVGVARDLGYRHEAIPMRFNDGTRMRRISRLEEEETLTLDYFLVDEHLEPVWSTRGVLETEEGPLSVVSREGLIRMKTAAGRDQDVADVRRLEEIDR
ncbi:MAG TPA: hypothetical protein VMV46_07390 [Thermoanaerobaculia bacterium]|nr:hypothetical protein [Thermoanaerobaculia bacterium]